MGSGLVQWEVRGLAGRRGEETARDWRDRAVRRGRREPILSGETARGWDLEFVVINARVGPGVTSRGGGVGSWPSLGARGG